MPEYSYRYSQRDRRGSHQGRVEHSSPCLTQQIQKAQLPVVGGILNKQQNQLERQRHDLARARLNPDYDRVALTKQDLASKTALRQVVKQNLEINTAIVNSKESNTIQYYYELKRNERDLKVNGVLRQMQVNRSVHRTIEA